MEESLILFQEMKTPLFVYQPNAAVQYVQWLCRWSLIREKWAPKNIYGFGEALKKRVM